VRTFAVLSLTTLETCYVVSYTLLLLLPPPYSKISVPSPFFVFSEGFAKSGQKRRICRQKKAPFTGGTISLISLYPYGHIPGGCGLAHSFYPAWQPKCIVSKMISDSAGLPSA
jgi:hypothetical protein